MIWDQNIPGYVIFEVHRRIAYRGNYVACLILLISIDTIADFIYTGSSYQASYRLGWVSAIFGNFF